MIDQLNRYVFRFILVVLFQVIVLNNIQFSGYIIPYFYIWYILVLPFETPGWLLLLSAFLLGLGIDVFPQGLAGNGSSIGTHAAACVLIAYLRPTVLRWINPRDEYEPGTYPDSKNFGILWFLGYALIMIGIHHFVLFFLEDLSLRDILRTLVRILFSGVFSLIIILLWEGIRFKVTR
ncbi:MAG: rod shape-determining protein MreD [Bacteroidota bacterium]